MKLIHISLAIAAAALALAGCDRVSEGESNFDNKVYIQQAESNNTQSITLKAKDVTLSKDIQAALAKPQQTDVTVTYKADPSLADHFVQATGIQCTVLDAAHYSLSADQALIPAGSVRSNEVQVNFAALNELDRDINYLLPVTIQHSVGVDILESSKTLYYVLRQGATINTAVYAGENYFELPTFATSPAVQNLTEVTFEALINPHAWKSISSIMGVEGYFLIRVGDTFPQNVVQLAHPLGNLRGPELTAGDWMHFACTYDIAGKSFKWYINGELKQENVFSWFQPTISLGTNPANTNKFFLGYSYAFDRWFDGDMCEVRIWNKVRTQQEIADNIYEVDPATEGLVAYWKFDEGSGKEIKDHSSSGNHAVAKNPVTWIKVELPASN